MTTFSRVQCSWCLRVLQEGSEPTSHDICERCALLLESDDGSHLATQEEMHVEIPLLPDPYPGSHVESEA